MDKIVEGVFKGVGRLFDVALEMEKQGKSEYVKQGEFTGKTEHGKEVKGSYGFRVKIGL